MVDFGALPPEITSARMYAGPGSSSLQAAASAWNGIAAELSSAASPFHADAAACSDDEPGPEYMRAELNSGGNAPKSTIEKPP